MVFNKIFSRVLAVCVALTVFAMTVAAQSETRLHQATSITTTAIEPDGTPRLENDLVIISRAKPPAANSATLRFDQLLLTAIDSRLGSRYVWGAAGPRVFDCSGFVWSSFQQIGAEFTRGSARSYWARFPTVKEDEKFKLGTLVFFNGLSHVGIVADEKGFYHASRRKGVVYQEWNKYYLSRVDGFRRVPLPNQLMASAE